MEEHILSLLFFGIVHSMVPGGVLRGEINRTFLAYSGEIFNHLRENFNGNNNAYASVWINLHSRFGGQWKYL